MSDPRKAIRRLAIPALSVIAIILVVPWLLTFGLSFFEWQFTGYPKFIGLSNYVAVFGDRRFHDSIWRTFLYTSGATVLPLILGLLAALIFARDFPGRQALRLAFSFPMLATPVSVALVWVMMLHPQSGVLNYLLSLIGLPPSTWIYSQKTVIATLVMIETWQWTPLVALILIGGLTTIPEEIYEAAEIDGASTWQAFTTITLPYLTPYLFVAGILRAIDAIKSLDLIFVMTSGGPGTASETINMYLYLNAFSFYNVGYASAISVLFLGIVFVLALGLVWLKSRQSVVTP
jgi:multiple sugar transport system permease protein